MIGTDAVGRAHRDLRAVHVRTRRRCWLEPASAAAPARAGPARPRRCRSCRCRHRRRRSRGRARRPRRISAASAAASAAGLPTPEPIVVPGPIADPVFPARELLRVDAGGRLQRPGFGIRRTASPAEIFDAAVGRGGRSASRSTRRDPSWSMARGRAGAGGRDAGRRLARCRPGSSSTPRPARSRHRCAAPASRGELTVVLSASLPTGEIGVPRSCESFVEAEREGRTRTRRLRTTPIRNRWRRSPPGSALRNATRGRTRAVRASRHSARS